MISYFIVVGAGDYSNSTQNFFISFITKEDKLVLTTPSFELSKVKDLFKTSSMSKSEVLLFRAELIYPVSVYQW